MNRRRASRITRSPRPDPDRSRSGVALILSLVILALLASLALAIFFTSRTERSASSLFAGTVETRLLADTSVNLCMAQISDATGADNRAWASQPGMIRTFTGNRVPAENYRLYSWSPMRTSGAFDPAAAENAVPEGWADLPALYVDLNEPAPDPDHPADTSLDQYPILYPPGMTAFTPSSGAASPVEGYEITENLVGAGADAMPMPVQWLYVLEDGTVHPPVPVPGNDRQVRVGAATAANPIRGRIAFWADDESAKININTAAGGKFWTEPRFSTSPEEATGGDGMGFSQPVRGEYQRYPGHPARTDLRAVFPELGVDAIYRITPRVSSGGSRDGTVRMAPDLIRPDADRLYSSVGELRFAALKPSDTGSRESQTADGTLFAPLDDADLWARLVEKRKGFLSASSRAPELNLFGAPRIAIWPIHALEGSSGGKPYRTALDKLIAFCSTLNNGTLARRYYFTRQAAMSPDTDIGLERNRELLGYLQRLTDRPFPGVGSEPFSGKYGGKRGRDQILTEVFDYIRATNLQDMDSKLSFAPDAVVVPSRADLGNGATSGFGRSFAVHQAGLLFICNADYRVPESNRAPQEPETAENEDFKENLALLPYDQGGKLTEGQRRIQALFMVELFSPSAGFKSHTLYPYFRITGLDGVKVNDIPLGFPADALSTRPGSYLGSFPGGFGSNGGIVNFMWHFQANAGGGQADRSYDVVTTGALAGAAGGYPFISVPVTIDAEALNEAGGGWDETAMTVTGGKITISIYADAAETIPLGSSEIDLGSLAIRPPRLHPGYAPGVSAANGHPGGNNSNENPPNPKEWFWAFQKSGIFGGGMPPGRFGRLRDNEGNETGQPKSSQDGFMAARRPYADHGGLFTWYDSVATWILPHGDYRTLFGPTGQLKDYAQAKPGGIPHLRHFLGTFLRGMIGYNTTTTFADGIAMRPFWAPAMEPVASYPSGLNAPWTFGDWDTGVPIGVPDGPLINKTDEGSLYQNKNLTLNPYLLEPGRSGDTQSSPTINYHSANRQVPSAVMFGSLPTGLIEGAPWQTLLFRPAPAGHPGAADPPDHLLLDLFWMPVVEPYAISEPFSTAGKVNMNYQMIPFTWVERSTALRAVLRDEKLLAVPDDEWSDSRRDAYNQGYAKKNGGATETNPIFKMPLDLDLDQTLAPFRTRFQSGALFLSASEIAAIPLIPAGETASGIDDFWSRHRMTGDNLKERPYAHLYPRLTTRSNVYNVHYRVQSLRYRPGDAPDVWDETRGSVHAELRGNTLIERYIDMNRSDIPDYATEFPAPEGDDGPDDGPKSAESLYRFRVLSNKEFNP